MTLKIVGLTGSDDKSAGSGKDTVAEMLVERHGFVRVALADPMKRFCRDVFGWSPKTLWGPTDERNRESSSHMHGGPLHGGYAGAFSWHLAYTRFEKAAPDWLRYIGAGEASLVPLRAWFVGLMLGALGIDLLTFEKRAPLRLSARMALQSLGTEWGRTQRADLWINHLRQVARLLHERNLSYWKEYGIYVSLDSVGVERAGVVVPDVRFANEAEAIREDGGVLVQVERHGADGLTGSIGSHSSEHGLAGVVRDATIRNDGTLAELAAKVDAFVRRRLFTIPDEVA